MHRIVLTGGPGAGKTVITAALAASEPEHFVLVPEAATQVYRELRTRWDRLDIQGRRDVQRRIYHLQRAQEDRLAAEHPHRTLILDRGTVDGATYWPEGPEAYWLDLGTTLREQLDRYDAVIWMESCAALPGVYDGDGSNPCRFEDAASALAAGASLARLWSAHPNLRRIPAFPHLGEKIEAVRRLINLRLPPVS
jgi:predicted ATPase